MIRVQTFCVFAAGIRGRPVHRLISSKHIRSKMSAPEVTEEKVAVDEVAPVAVTAMETDAPVHETTETTAVESKTEQTAAAVPEFPEALRGKTDEEINEIKKKIVERCS